MSSLYVDTELVHRACSRAHWVSRDSSQYFTSFWDQGPWVYVCFVSGHVRQEALSSQNTINVLDMRRGEGKPQSLCSVTLVSGRTGQKTTVSESNCSSMFSSSALMCFFLFFFFIVTAHWSPELLLKLEWWDGILCSCTFFLSWNFWL